VFAEKPHLTLTLIPISMIFTGTALRDGTGQGLGTLVNAEYAAAGRAMNIFTMVSVKTMLNGSKHKLLPNNACSGTVIMSL